MAWCSFNKVVRGEKIRMEDKGLRMRGDEKWIIYHVLPPTLIFIFIIVNFNYFIIYLIVAYYHIKYLYKFSIEVIFNIVIYLDLFLKLNQYYFCQVIRKILVSKLFTKYFYTHHLLTNVFFLDTA